MAEQNEQVAAIARLEAHVTMLTDGMRRLEQKMDAMESTLTQAKGGVAVLRWLGLGSLAGVITAGVAVYNYLHRQ
jgi:hypothetical protein